MHLYQPLADQSIQEICRAMITLAMARDEPVTCTHDGFAIIAKPGDQPQELLREYRAFAEQRARDPEYRANRTHRFPFMDRL